jgi:cell division protease FtsH
VLLDEEVHRLVDEAHAGVAEPLSEHRDELDNLAQALLQPETLDAPDAYAAAGIPMPRTDSSRPDGRGELP